MCVRDRYRHQRLVPVRIRRRRHQESQISPCHSTFQNESWARPNLCIAQCNLRGLLSGHGCITTRLKTGCFATPVSRPVRKEWQCQGEGIKTHSFITCCSFAAKLIKTVHFFLFLHVRCVHVFFIYVMQSSIYLFHRF